MDKIASKSPKISRFITESHKKVSSVPYLKIFFVSFLSGLILVAIVLQGVRLQTNLQKEKIILQERQMLTSEVSYWKDVSGKYTNYRDVYYRLAVLEYKLGNFEESQKQLQKALEIDPNFEQGRVLGEKIGF